MRKITFITLVMIFGVSSVSFGKQYLCVSNLSRMITIDGVKHNPIGKFLVLTKCDVKCIHQRGDYIYSVKSFGIKGKVWCKDNPTIKSPDSLVLSCNEKSKYGNTKVEFNMNFRTRDFIGFQMFNSTFGKRIQEYEYYKIWMGSCEEIKF